MGQLVDDKVDHLVHVNLLSLDFNRDVRLVAFEGAVVSYADWLARAIVARNGSLQLGVVVLRQDDDGLVKRRPLLRSHAHDALFNRVVVGNEGAKILAPSNGYHTRRRRLQFFYQRLEWREFMIEKLFKMIPKRMVSLRMVSLRMVLRTCEDGDVEDLVLLRIKCCLKWCII